MKKLLCAALAACALAAGAALAQGGSIALEGAPYVLEGTEVRTVRARELGRDYQIYVSLPASYARSGRSYPVVFVTDAPYTFPLARAIAWRAGRKGRAIGEFILVGLSYANGETAEYSRRRDYTPGPTADTDVTSDMPGREPKFGEAAAYARYLANDVFPMVAKHYRADMNRKTYIGHTFGALLGLDMLFSERPLFEQYVLGSPSLWFGRRMMVEREKAYAATHKDLRAAVFIAAGDSGGRKDVEALRDAKALHAALKSRNYPSLRLAGAVIHEEDQMTAPPAIITRGLRWAVPGSE
jgi:predicted alpha/beta superfamily hydrolase